MKKYVPLVLASAFGVLLLTSCTTTTTDGDTDGDGSSSAMSSSTAASVAASTSASVVTGSPRVIAVTAESWNFTPNAITVKKGETIVLRVTGKSGVHGLAIPGLGINVPVPMGQTVDVTIPTDKVGTFEFLCSVPCGKGHRDMRGTIVITD